MSYCPFFLLSRLPHIGDQRPAAGIQFLLLVLRSADASLFAETKLRASAKASAEDAESHVCEKRRGLSRTAAPYDMPEPVLAPVFIL